METIPLVVTIEFMIKNNSHIINDKLFVELHKPHNYKSKQCMFSLNNQSFIMYVPIHVYVNIILVKSTN